MLRVAIYARVSTDLQKRRQTSAGQVEACRALVRGREATVIGTFVDEHVSGSTPTTQRPAGGRLLRLAGTGALDAIVVTRLDRLSRRPDDPIFEQLATSRVQVWSVSEGVVDVNSNATIVGEALYYAQLELSIVAERMTYGRDLAVRTGRWTGGPVPFGYDLDNEGRLTPSGRMIGDTTEADIARSVFARLATGSSTVIEARRLDDLGAPPVRRYSQRLVLSSSGRWLPSRINQMVRNTVYVGKHRFGSRQGLIERQVPALVSDDVWQAVQTRLASRIAHDAPRREYLLRGLIVCARCECHFVGTVVSSGNWRDHYYRCAGALAVVNPRPEDRCRSKSIPAVWVEEQIYALCVTRGGEERSSFEDRRSEISRHILHMTMFTDGEGTARTGTLVVQLHDQATIVIPVHRRPRRERTN